MKANTRIALFATAVGLTGLVNAVQAEESNNSVRLGAYFVHYDAHASDISGPYTPSGVNLKVDDVQTVYFAYVRRLSPSLAVEVAGGVPPKTNTVGKGPATLGSVPYAGQNIGTSKWFSPTFLLIYRFLDESEALRPYVGLGFNYTHFFDNKSTPAGDAANGGPTSISLSNSFGGAATVGVSYRLQDRWSLYASYSVSQVKSDMVATTAGVQRKTTIDFNPSAVVLAVGYSF